MGGASIVHMKTFSVEKNVCQLCSIKRSTHHSLRSIPKSIYEPSTVECGRTCSGRLLMETKCEPWPVGWRRGRNT
jgi:hypothetical protein